MTSQHKPVVLRKWKQALKLHCVSTPKNVSWNVAAKKKYVRYRGEKKSSKKSKHSAKLLRVMFHCLSEP